MKALLLLAPLLLTACAAAAPLPKRLPDPGPPFPDTWPRPPHPFVCQASTTANYPYGPLKPLPEISMSEEGERSVSADGFRFQVTYDNDRYEVPSLNVYVYWQPTGKLIEQTLFQLDPINKSVNQFLGGHGFTGLHYVYGPDGTAQLQYVCTSG
ncbi:MAG: hypothetical protein ACM3ZV_12810 [Bacillota bacterium]